MTTIPVPCSPDSNCLSLPITQEMIDTAHVFAAEQATPQKQQDVFNNTLAVYAVHSYMKMMEIETQLEVGDSWNLYMRQFSDVADLHLLNMGYLECRPFDLQTSRCSLPLDLPDDRLGLVAVALDCQGREAKLLGFTETVIPGTEVSLDQLRSLDYLLDFIEQLHPKSINLVQWLDGLFEAGWQTVDTLVGNTRWCLALGFMSEPIQLQPPIAGAKLIDLELDMGTQSVVMLVAIARLSEDKFEIRVQIHPNKDETYIPKNLKLELLSDKGQLLRTVISRQSDNLIQLPRFQCSSNEKFEIQLSQDRLLFSKIFTL